MCLCIHQSIFSSIHIFLLHYFHSSIFSSIHIFILPSKCLLITSSSLLITFIPPFLLNSLFLTISRLIAVLFPQSLFYLLCIHLSIHPSNHPLTHPSIHSSIYPSHIAQYTRSGCYTNLVWKSDLFSCSDGICPSTLLLY